MIILMIMIILQWLLVSCAWLSFPLTKKGFEESKNASKTRILYFNETIEIYKHGIINYKMKREEIKHKWRRKN